MTYQILVHTPLWVWAMLLALVLLGLTQAFTRHASLRRVILLPLVVTGLSLHGTLSPFEANYWNWVLWIGAALASLAWFATSELPAGVHYDAVNKVFWLPGSWVPLGLMMAIFLTRYVFGVVLAMEPALTKDPAVTAIVASVYGALSGVFIGRMVGLWRLTRASDRQPPAGASAAWG